jgi:hypothetical protein
MDKHRRMLDWVDAYEVAWRTTGTAGLGALFTADATYLPSPYSSPIVGLDDIALMWERERESPAEVFTLSRDVVAVDGDIGVVRCLVRYGDPPTREYTDLWVIDLAPDGRCRRFEEWPFWPHAPWTAG